MSLSDSVNMDPLDAQLDYVSGIVRLMIWYARELAFRRQTPVPLSEALELRVDILRKTSLYDGRHPALGLDPPNPAWDKLKDQLDSIIRNHAEDAATDELEDACWATLEPLIIPRISDECEKHQRTIERTYQCWTYIFRPYQPDDIDIHFGNACRPESPFGAAHRRDLIRTLLQMLTDAKQTHPAAGQVVCGIWLNQFPPFQACFPAVWTETFTPSEFSSATHGHWGQYMDHRGAFHARNASDFRHLGRHPYACGRCRCTLESAIQHAKDLINRIRVL